MLSGKGVLASKQAQNKKRKALIKSRFLGILIVGGISSGVYSIPRYEEINIVNIFVSGNEVIEKNEISKLAEEKLQGSKYFIFPNRNIFLYPKFELTNAIKDLSPDVLSASVNFKDLKSISISVVERQPFALWCGNSYEFNIDHLKCYFLDKEGFIFDEAPQFSGNAYIRYFGTTSEPYLRSQFLNPILFQALSRLTAELKKKGFETVSVNYKSSGEIIINLETGSQLIFSEKTDYGRIVTYLSELVLSKEFKGINELGKLNVSYVDFRFGNKIFYKP